MSCCVGVLLESGLVLASDSRTNAGVDNVSTFRKMSILERRGERVITLLSAGNLAVTQSALSILDEWTKSESPDKNVLLAPSLYRVARVVGEALREVYRLDADALKSFQTEFNGSFIVAGQIKGEPHRLFQVYAAGNSVEATRETQFFQLGETKYGKPVLDRILTPSMTLAEAAKLVLISFDSTMRSNLSVGLPLHLLTYRTDSLAADPVHTFSEQDPYLAELRRRWGEGLRTTFETIPAPHLGPSIVDGS